MTVFYPHYRYINPKIYGSPSEHQVLEDKFHIQDDAVARRGWWQRRAERWLITRLVSYSLTVGELDC